MNKSHGLLLCFVLHAYEIPLCMRLVSEHLHTTQSDQQLLSTQHHHTGNVPSVYTASKTACGKRISQWCDHVFINLNKTCFLPQRQIV